MVQDIEFVDVLYFHDNRKIGMTLKKVKSKTKQISFLKEDKIYSERKNGEQKVIYFLSALLGRIRNTKTEIQNILFIISFVATIHVMALI